MKINPMQLNPSMSLQKGKANAEQQLQGAEKLKETYQTFVGELYFGQMLKSMQSTVGKPAYFHGGQAEEIFRGQLTQVMSQEMTKASADTLADPMFRQQFPQQAEILRAAEENDGSSLADLDQLRRR